MALTQSAAIALKSIDNSAGSPPSFAPSSEAKREPSTSSGSPAPVLLVREEDKAEAKQIIIVGIFCGTDYNFRNEAVEGGEDDPAFNQIAAEIAEDKTNTHVFGYSGCHKHGGGVTATGCDVIANQFLEEIKTINAAAAAKGNREKIKLHLIGHSRGCISIYMLIKRINGDPVLRALRDRFEFTLDLRDPVPGNFGPSPSVVTCTTTELRDLSTCPHVKTVNVSLYSEETYPAGYRPLIPLFHPDTQINVEYLPGNHNCQQQNPPDPKKEPFFNTLHILGRLKSLYLLLKNGIPLADKSLTIDKLKINQIVLYEKIKKLLPSGVESRKLHFDGEYKRAHVVYCSTLNARHADLLGVEDNSLFNYHGDRPELLYSHHQLRCGIQNHLLRGLEKDHLAALHAHVLRRQLMSPKDKQDWLRKTLTMQVPAKHIDYICRYLLNTIRDLFPHRPSNKAELAILLHCYLERDEAKAEVATHDRPHLFRSAPTIDPVVCNEAARLTIEMLADPSSAKSYTVEHIQAFHQSKKLKAMFDLYLDGFPEKFKEKAKEIKEAQERELKKQQHKQFATDYATAKIF